jgi:phage anti-repressor protein
MLKINENNRVLGREIHSAIESKTKQYSIWINRALIDADLKEDKDFYTKLYKSTGGRPQRDYEFTIDAAKEICLLERNEKGKKIRQWLISLGNKYETGLLLSREQINFLFELVKVMGLFSIQDYSEKKHFELHNNKYDWWAYRAAILGYGTNQLRTEVEKLNHKYKSVRQALIHIDKYELIRIGIIDLFIALGKSNDYAENIANVCKDMAKQLKVSLWDDSERKNSIPFQVDYDKKLEQVIKGNQLMIE